MQQKNHYPKAILFSVLGATLFACTKQVTDSAKLSSTAVHSRLVNSNLLSGLNQNWALLPALTNTVMIHNIDSLSPEMIRFPGGTVGHDWEWTTGTTSNPNQNAHPLNDVKLLADATGAKVIFMLDVVHHTIENQIAMLDSANALGIPVEYVELGNELYAKDKGYEISFPGGSDYADSVNSWVPKIKTAYPDVKIAALLLGRPVNPGNTRLYQWNDSVTANITADIDAYTYHIYISNGSDFQDERNDFDTVRAATPTGDKELWITEYGNTNPSTATNYLADLDSLANYVESYPGVTIALSHQIIGAQFSKLTTNGNSFTAEGELFLARAAARNNP